MKLLAACLLLLLSLSPSYAQPQFAPVRLDSETDMNFFYPTIEITGQNYIRASWASQNPDWIGAYAREVDMAGNIVTTIDTLEIGSTDIVSCPPIVSFYQLSDGAWCKMIYHA